MGIHDRKYMADESGHRRSPMGGGMPKTFTAKYVIVCAVFVLVDALTNYSLQVNFTLTSSKVYDFELWRPLTAFVLFTGPHQEIMKLVILFVFYSLGNQIENILGFKQYVNLLITMALGMFVVGVLIPDVVMVGYVSGLLSGLFLAYGLFLGNQRMTLKLFFIIPLTLSGYMLIAFTVGIIVLMTLVNLSNWFVSIPMLGACFASYVYITQYQKGSYIDFLKLLTPKKKPATQNTKTPPRKPTRMNTNQSGFKVLDEEDENMDDLDAYISDKVDPILEKIATSGMSSLTAKEKKILENAKKKMGK